MKHTYLNTADLSKYFGYTDPYYRPVIKRIKFIREHPERYGPHAVIKSDTGRWLCDPYAFEDAYRFKRYIELGIAPEFRKGG